MHLYRLTIGITSLVIKMIIVNCKLCISSKAHSSGVSILVPGNWLHVVLLYKHKITITKMKIHKNHEETATHHNSPQPNTMIVILFLYSSDSDSACSTTRFNTTGILKNINIIKKYCTISIGASFPGKVKTRIFMSLKVHHTIHEGQC